MLAHHKRFVLPFLCSLILQAAPAHSAGFYIQEQSVSGLGRAFAGSAAHPEDSSTLYYNPAGMTNLDKAQGQAGAHLLRPRLEFRDDGTAANTTLSGGTVAPGNSGDGDNPYDINAVPNLFYSQPLGDSDLWLGFGVTAPFGLASEYEEGWFGRYDSTSSVLKVIDFAPSVAFRGSEKWSFGFGVNIQYAETELERAIPDPLSPGGPTPQTDGVLVLEGDSVAVGYNAGLLWQPQARTSIGLHYRSEVNHRIEGSLNGRTPVGIGGGVNFRVGAEADLDLPQIATLAATHRLDELDPRLTLLGHVIWFGWDSFRRIHVELDNGGDLIDPQDYEDSFAFALGSEYLLNDHWILRAGFQYDQTPTTGANRTTRTPDGNRTWLSGGATYQLNDQLSLDVAGTYILVDEGHVDRTANFNALYGLFGAGGAQATVNTRGTAESSVGILGLAVNYRF